MLRLGESVRLTRREAERLELITGFPVVNVRTLGDFERYVRECKVHYADATVEYQVLAWLIDEAVSSCLAAG